MNKTEEKSSIYIRLGQLVFCTCRGYNNISFDPQYLTKISFPNSVMYFSFNDIL